MFIGSDFTSAPKRSNPLYAVFVEHQELLEVRQFETHLEWAKCINECSGTVAIDAPFGYPQEFIDELNLGVDWITLARNLKILTLKELEFNAKIFKDRRPPGRKEVRRTTDIRNQASSAMHFGFPAVGAMAHALIPILHEFGFNIPTVRSTSHLMTAVEVYPAIFARSVIGKEPYKSGKHLEVSRENRKRLLENIDIRVSGKIADEIIKQPTADLLDSLIAVYEALLIKDLTADQHDPREGWIFTSF